MNICVSRGRVTHIDITKYTNSVPALSDCTTALRWNIWKSRGRKVKLPRLFLFMCKDSAWVSPRLEEPKLRPLSVLLVHLHLNRFTAHYCTPSLTPRSSSSASPLRQVLSLVLSLWHSSLSHVHTHTLSFFLTSFICTLIIFFFFFFWRLLYSKRHFLVRFFFFLEILRNPQVPITQTVRYCFANERRAFFHIYLLLRSSLHISMTIRTRETCVSSSSFAPSFLYLFSLRRTSFVLLHKLYSSRNSSAL